MKVALVTCFNAEWHLGRLPAPYIPLNLLCLGASLRERGHEVELIDQTLALSTGKVEGGSRFHENIAALIAQRQPDVVGFATMCNSYPQSLTLARHCKQALPGVKIVMGGPQATAVDMPTLRHFPWVDVIVRGEADHSFPDLIDHWHAGENSLGRLSGLSWRDPGGKLYRTDAKPLLDVDVLPFPAYDLYPSDQLYGNTIPVEAGRGCPFACTFCSTNLFFSRKYRIKSPARLVAEMEHLRDTCHSTKFDLVHDMLTVDQSWVRDFSRLLIARQHGFKWGCSARVDCVTPELFEEMAAAGCEGIFFGIETGSQRMQPVVKKKLHTTQVLPALKQCADLQMKPTASFITGFPEENTEDAMATLEMALDVMQLSPDTNVQLHMLAPLVGSPLYELHKNNLKFDGHSSDISLFLLTDEEIETVKRCPDVFPSFYFIPTPDLNRNLVKALSAALYTCAPLLLAARKSHQNVTDIFTSWVAWQENNVDPETTGQDYYLARFQLDFVRFLQQRYPAAEGGPLATLVDYYATQFGIEKGQISDPLVFRRFEFDVDDLNRSLRTNEKAWTALQSRRWGLLFVNLGGNGSSGFTFLEVPITSRSIEPGDELEVLNLPDQILNQSKLIIQNKTKARVLIVEHHLDQKMIGALGLAAHRDKQSIGAGR